MATARMTALCAAWLLSAATGLALAAAQLPAAEAADCQFNLGFKALRDQIPNVVGECLEDEHHNPENGDALQATTRGLLVWRKADNWTAFTDGTITWINGPRGLQSRPNGERFSWEQAAPAASQPAQAPAATPQGTPAPTATPVPQPQPIVSGSQAAGPIEKDPAEIALGLGDVGKEIVQVHLKSEHDGRGRWAETRFVRTNDLANARLGPLKVVSRVHVANSVADAQAVFKDEVGKQSRMPEAQDRVGSVYLNDGKDPLSTVARVGDELDSRGACNDDCNSKSFTRLHQRTVMRYQNVVTVLYFWGRDDQATTLQTDEWLRVLMGRID